jgi:hypothetical protein
MVLIVQTISALLGITVTFLIFENRPSAPAMVYMAAAFFSGWLGTWLYARWKVGRGVTVPPSLAK